MKVNNKNQPESQPEKPTEKPTENQPEKPTEDQPATQSLQKFKLDDVVKYFTTGFKDYDVSMKGYFIDTSKGVIVIDMESKLKPEAKKE